MELISIRYAPHWLVTLTRAEVLQLEDCSQRHYDFKCQSLSKQGGKIYGMKNSLEYGETPGSCTVELSWGDIDIICKVLEQSTLCGYTGELFYKLLNLLKTERNKS